MFHRFFTTATKIPPVVKARVMRMDTHGNLFTMRDDLSLEKAREIAEIYQNKGHHQTYWAEEVQTGHVTREEPKI